MVIAQRDWRRVAKAESRRCLRQKAIKKVMLNVLAGPGNNETGTGSFLTESNGVAAGCRFRKGRKKAGTCKKS